MKPKPRSRTIFLILPRDLGPVGATIGFATALRGRPPPPPLLPVRRVEYAPIANSAKKSGVGTTKSCISVLSAESRISSLPTSTTL